MALCSKFVSRKRIRSSKVATVEFQYPWKPLICIECKMFGHATTKCKPTSSPPYKPRVVPKAEPDNNNVNKPSEWRHVKTIWRKKNSNSYVGVDQALKGNMQAMHAQVCGSSSKPANGSHGRPSTTIISTQDNKFAALANDTTAVGVQPSAARLGDCVTVVETEDNLFDSPPVLENHRHHMYETLVDTSEDDYTYAIDDEDIYIYICISSQTIEVGSENMVTTPLIK
ncbi:hypothetical protein IFM89_010299, partial [Coptis chinensis]